MITFTEDDVVRLLPMREAIESLRRAFRDYAEGRAQNQPRRRLFLPTGSVLHQMAAWVGDYFGTKIYATNVKYGAHFTFLLYDAATAEPLAQFEANHLGQLRTGAASGLAADLLLPEGPIRVAMIGSGFQARTQLEALRCVRQIKTVRVWSRHVRNRERFSARMGAEAVASAAEACQGADVIVTATWAKDPVVPEGSVDPTALILAMGSNVPTRREIPEALVRRARIVVDDIEQCKLEAGDLVAAEIDWSAVTSLGELAANLGELAVNNEKAGESRRLTIFKSVGIALEDVAVAAHIFQAATPEQSSAGPNLAMR